MLSSTEIERRVAVINALIGYEAVRIVHADDLPAVVRSSDALRNYQVYMARQCVRKKAILLAVDMGLGKTAAVLTALVELFSTGEIRKGLIIGPLRVCTDTWPDEIAVWEHTRHLTFSVIVGTAAEKKRALNKNTQLHIVNRENIPWLWKALREGEDWDYDIAVIDEASMLKAGKKRSSSKALSRFGILARARHKVDRVIEMTGTPAPEGLHNLWGLAYIMDLGERLGTSRTAFERRWFNSDYMGWSLEPKDFAERQIMERLKDVMIGMRAEDYLELPPVVTTPFTDRWVTLPKDVMQEYKRFERTLYSHKYDVEAITRGVLVNKLCQFANGSMYGEDGDRRKIVPVHDLKLDALCDMVDEFQGESLMIAYRFRFDLARIRKKFPKAIVLNEDKDAIKKWNAGKIDKLLVHPASVGHGTNLQFGGHILIHYGLQHSGELYKQINMRLPRPGQKNDKVFIYHILAKGTADETILAEQARKDATERSIFDAVRVRLREAA